MKFSIRKSSFGKGQKKSEKFIKEKSIFLEELERFPILQKIFVTERLIRDDSLDMNTKETGHFHMEFYLDKILIGVSNQDHLDNGIISNYFFFEPIFKKLNFGIFSSIIEIYYLKMLNLELPDYKYYSIGAYIHDNSKVNYKSLYKPFQITCPVTRKWVDFDKDLAKKLSKKEHCLGKINKSEEIEVEVQEFSQDMLGYLAEIKSMKDIYVPVEDFGRNDRGQWLQDEEIFWVDDQQYRPLSKRNFLFYYLCVKNKYTFRYLGKNLASRFCFLV